MGHPAGSRAKILAAGREDELDRNAVKRLVIALSRLLDPAGAVAATAGGELTLTSSRPVGGTYVLDQLWQRLGIDAVLRRQLAGRTLDPRVERVVFALVANRALAASSKLAATSWIAYDVHLPGLTGGDSPGVRRRLLPGDGLADPGRGPPGEGAYFDASPTCLTWKST